MAQMVSFFWIAKGTFKIPFALTEETETKAGGRHLARGGRGLLTDARVANRH